MFRSNGVATDHFRIEPEISYIRKSYIPFILLQGNTDKRIDASAIVHSKPTVRYLVCTCM